MTRKEFLNVALLQATEEGIGIHLAKFADICIKWGQQHPHWINVEDELPPMDKDVLVITKAKRLIIAKCCYPAPLNDWWDSDGRYMQNDKPTHWMPLPSPPTCSVFPNNCEKGGEE